MTPRIDTTPAISVIVPVYNVQDFIVECLDSLTKQNFNRTFEILLIDDCSTDNSKKLCEDFVAAHPQLAKLICQPENQGVAVARNRGIEAATGDYFAFVDPDDLLPLDALEILYSAAIAHQADIVKGSNIIFDEKSAHPAGYNVKKIKTYEGNTILSVFLEHKETRGHSWGKLFRSTAFDHVRYTHGVTMAEDTLYCAEIFSDAKKLVIIDNIVYNYRLRNSGSTGRKFQTGAYLWWLYSIENCGRFISTHSHQKHFKELQIRTLLQLVREARALSNPLLREVTEQIIIKQIAWKINLPTIIELNLGPKTLLHFVKLKLTLSKLKQRAKQQGTIKTVDNMHSENIG